MGAEQRQYLDFEKPVAELEGKIAELQAMSEAERGPNIRDEIRKLREKSSRALTDLYSGLDPWQKTQVARHSDRPHFTDYIRAMATDWTELAGDRTFGEDAAIIGGLARVKGQRVVLIGHEKGRTTQTRLKHNFGMANPEGYRKAIRLMDLAERFCLPVITLVDTAGAYPGQGAEERGQAEAIARSTERCLTLNVPIISVIVGEGGSGGAVALAAANRVAMLEHAIYSVISPEGCASILWRDAKRAKDAAEAMKITAQDLLSMKVIDEIIPEPSGGAHRDPTLAVQKVSTAIARMLKSFEGMSGADLKAQRRDRFLAIGRVGL
jgi:acetyl-CoA carboxylase carboxyl transferase subunit alpha